MANPTIDNEFDSPQLDPAFSIYIPKSGPTSSLTASPGNLRSHISATGRFDHWSSVDEAPQLRLAPSNPPRFAGSIGKTWWPTNLTVDFDYLSADELAPGPTGGREEILASTYTLSDPITKRVELSYTQSNIGRETLTDVHIYIGVPIPLPEQEIETLSWSPQPTRYVYDIFGQKIADFDIGTLRPGQRVTLEFTAVGKFWRIRYDVDPDKVGSLDDIPQEIVYLYTSDGPYYRITDPLIVSTAQRVVGDERNPYLMALRIHDFVAGTLRAEPLGRWDDAVTVLRRGTGSCSEFTFVFIALARAVGLPARFASGSIYLPSRAVGGRFVDRVHHRWPEAYIPNYGWVPFDPTWDMAGVGRPVSHEYAGSHGYALVMVRGGGTDGRYFGIYYPVVAHWRGSSQLASELEFVWSDP